MSTVTEFLTTTWRLLAESAPYLLVGFFLAGLIKTVVSAERVERHLGTANFRSVLRAALYGIPIPLCSCSVIPTAASLRKSGASKGATSAFLISTPETGVDSIGVTWALFNPLITLVRPLAAFISALVTGALVNRWTAGDSPPSAPAAPQSCCHAATAPGTFNDSASLPSPASRLHAAARYGYGKLLDDLTPWFIIGFLLSGLIATFTPADLFTESVPRGLAAMGLMLVVGLPLYVCATASTPIAATLIAKGLSPGAALVFLLVGPATNVTTLMVVRSMLGVRVLWIYLTSIAAVALGFGLALDSLYPALGAELAAGVSKVMTHTPGPLAHLAGGVLALLLLVSARRIRLLERWKGGFLFASGDSTAPAAEHETAAPLTRP